MELLRSKLRPGGKKAGDDTPTVESTDNAAAPQQLQESRAPIAAHADTSILAPAAPTVWGAAELARLKAASSEYGQLDDPPRSYEVTFSAFNPTPGALSCRVIAAVGRCCWRARMVLNRGRLLLVLSCLLD